MAYQPARGYDGETDADWPAARRARPREEPAPRRPPRGRGPVRRRRDTTGGAEGNERLTAATGAVLLVLFAAEGVTILAVRQLLTLHFFLGMLLIGPVMLKAASTIYRFARTGC